MLKLVLVLPLICVGLSACASTQSTNVCAGFSKLTPSTDTAVTIITKDRPFANQVASHNEQGSKQGCWE